jgi:hypothetical protein
MTPKPPRIATRCPACGNRTVIIGDDDKLVCTWMKCANPDVGEVIDTLKANSAVLKQLKAVLDTAKAEV